MPIARKLLQTLKRIIYHISDRTFPNAAITEYQNIAATIHQFLQALAQHRISTIQKFEIRNGFRRIECFKNTRTGQSITMTV